MEETTPSADTTFPSPEPGELAWVIDSVGQGTDPGVRTLLSAGLDRRVIDIARLASTGSAILWHLGKSSFDEVTDEDLADFVLTPAQGRAWTKVPGVLSLLRAAVRGSSKSLKFVICTGCGRWMVAKQVPESKSCPLTMDCTGPQVGIPPGIVTSTPAVQVLGGE